MRFAQIIWKTYKIYSWAWCGRWRTDNPVYLAAHSWRFVVLKNLGGFNPEAQIDPRSTCCCWRWIMLPDTRGALSSGINAARQIEIKSAIGHDMHSVILGFFLALFSNQVKADGSAHEYTFNSIDGEPYPFPAIRESSRCEYGIQMWFHGIWRTSILMGLVIKGWLLSVYHQMTSLVRTGSKEQIKGFVQSISMWTFQWRQKLSLKAMMRTHFINGPKMLRVAQCGISINTSSRQTVKWLEGIHR